MAKKEILKMTDEALEAQINNAEAGQNTAADAPAAVVLKDGWFWVGGRKFNTRLKAEKYLRELGI